MHADLVQIAPPFEAVHAPLHHHQAHAPGTLAGVGLDHDDHHIGQNAVGDEGLLAVDNVVIPLIVRAPHRGGADTLQIAARARLGHGDGDDARAVHRTGQPAGLLGLRAQPGDVGHGHVRVDGEAHAVGVGPGQFLGHGGAEAIVALAHAPVRFGHIHAQKAQGPGGFPDGPGHNARLFPFFVVGHDLLFDKVAQGAAKHDLLGGQVVVAHGWVSGSGWGELGGWVVGWMVGWLIC